jgi:hypothetical protein
MILTSKEERAMSIEAERFINRLSELGCDSVALLFSWRGASETTESRCIRAGNYWAQRGLMQGWLDSEKGHELAGFIQSDGGDDLGDSDG